MIKKFKKLSPDKLLNIIKKPMMTEKSTNLSKWFKQDYIYYNTYIIIYSNIDTTI